MEYDLKISGGTIIDGTGAPGRRGDVGIKDGKFVAVGEAKGSAAKTIDADGRVVAPGFVDIHTHYDAQVLWDRMLTISPWHGVTTVVMGNCGFGVAPTRPQHRDLILRTLEKVEGMSLDALRGRHRRRLAVRDLPAVPRRDRAARHRRSTSASSSATRRCASTSWARRPPSAPRPPTRSRRCEILVREAIDAGAVGFATSKAPTHVGYDGKPVPSRVAELDEIRALVGALGAARARRRCRRPLGPGLFFDEFAAIAARHRAADHVDGAARRHARPRLAPHASSSARSSCSSRGCRSCRR